MERQTIARALVIFNDENALLLHRSALDEHRPLEYDLPGGMSHEGETARSCAARETYEETGLLLRPSQMRLAWKQEAETKRREGVMLVNRRLFVANVHLYDDLQITLDPEEHDSYEVVPVTEIARKLNHKHWSEGIRHIVAFTLQSRRIER